MFNFFEALNNEFKLSKINSQFNVINMSNKYIYAEGHKGVVLISATNITFRVKNGMVVVIGEKLKISKITNSTLVIEGIIKKMENY